MTDTELKANPLATMDKVFHHVGLPPIPYDLDQVSREQLEQLYVCIGLLAFISNLLRC